ncbi:triose-phosphate isomerase [Desulforhabdus amnigena]|jgi:isopropylmalate/homocitrate/citramalate synthase|uniref:Histone-lysine N-methyltransferase n=1 Tax=Desulforhabdus amnigena TaxID=40218 RepID=A0A9W6LAW7_9BACT|nr:cache domain-containing protein [Desulforhabdus amnigena]NLJ27122.1 histone-lysine N-methyltransferase [Deltaproteobacteria bacterium]GLI36405.1 histone-lysine N-methyltransferase [Desulforhabdus amnigena]
MARWNSKKRVLEHEHSKFWQYRLVDVQEPNLMREIFPYEEVPHIDFDHMLLSIDPAEDIFITDTTFRDGQQARPPYTVKQIEAIFDLLHRLSGPNGVIRQSEFFLYTEKDREALELCLSKGYQYPGITGWIRAVEEDLQLVADCGLKETGILTSVSDYHIFLKLNLDRKTAMKKYLNIARAALDKGIAPRCHFEDITRADIYGFCVPFAIELMRLAEESGIPIKIRLCDTLGFGITYPGAALPRSVPRLIRTFIDDAGVPGSLLEWHGHNDFHKVLINAATAWLYGCAGANGTLLGFGERTGNAPIEGLLIEYIGLRGSANGVDTTAISDMAQYFQSELGYRIPPNYPFAGEEFNATRAGIHADGLVKHEEIYNIFDTQKLLKRPISIIITDKSGVASVAYWVNTRLHLEGERRLDKRHPGIVKIYKRVMREYDQGRNTSISTEELERWARRYLPEFFVSEFDRLKQKAYTLAAHLVEEVVENESIKSMDPARQEPILQTLLDLNPFIQYIYITDREGLKTTRNITHIVDKSKYESAKVGEDLSDRPWFIEPMKDGKVHVTDFYTSRYTGALCITVSAPITSETEEIVGILGIDIRFEDLAKMEEDESA